MPHGLEVAKPRRIYLAYAPCRQLQVGLKGPGPMGIIFLEASPPTSFSLHSASKMSSFGLQMYVAEQAQGIYAPNRPRALSNTSIRCSTPILLVGSIVLPTTILSRSDLENSDRVSMDARIYSLDGKNICQDMTPHLCPALCFGQIPNLNLGRRPHCTWDRAHSGPRRGPTVDGSAVNQGWGP